MRPLLPLSAGAEVKEVVRVLHGGGEQAVQFERRGSQENPAVWIKVADCGYETLYTEIRYVL